MSISALYIKPETLTLTDQDAYQASVMQYLPEELIVKIIQWIIPETNSLPSLALVCRTLEADHLHHSSLLPSQAAMLCLFGGRLLPLFSCQESATSE